MKDIPSEMGEGGRSGGDVCVFRGAEGVRILKFFHKLFHAVFDTVYFFNHRNIFALDKYQYILLNTNKLQNFLFIL